jgi:hypothetical protein
VFKDEAFMSNMGSSKTRALEKLATVQVGMMKTSEERLGKERQKEERKLLLHEKGAIVWACDVFSFGYDG